MKSVTLLLLTCGTNACYHIAKRLKVLFQDGIRIVGTDINQRWLIPAYSYLDAFYQCPLTSNEEYYGFILGVCKQEEVDYLMPSFDADQLLFYQGNKDLVRLGVKSLGITEEAMAIYHSKEETNDFLLKHCLPVPRFFKVEDVEDNKEYFCKPSNGVGSKGARKMSGIEVKSCRDDNLVVEEVCTEPEITLECFNYKGKVYSVARERLDTKSGVCTKARVYHDKELEDVAQSFADSIKLPYIFNLQFMTNDAGKKVITDVNLRTAGGMSLSFAAGWDEAEALGKIMLGEDNVEASLKAPKTDTYVMRAYTDIVTKRSERRIAFDLDGTLLDSRKRHQKVMDDVLKEFGMSLDTSDLVAYKSDGHNNKDWLRTKGLSGDLIERINQEWVALIENEEYLRMDKLYPGVYALLEKLSQSSALFLVTARNNKCSAEKQVSWLGLKAFFDDVAIVPSSITTSKEKTLFLGQYRTDVFYGDTESDMKAAEEAHCSFIAVLNGFRSSSFWNKYKVKTIETLDLLI